MDPIVLQNLFSVGFFLLLLFSFKMGQFDFLNTPALDGLEDENDMLSEGSMVLGSAAMPNHQFALPSGVTVRPLSSYFLLFFIFIHLSKYFL